MYERETRVGLVGLADQPTRPYLPVLVQKLAGSTDVHPYFSKCGHRVSRKYGNRYMNNESVDGDLSFVDICIFQAISGAEVYSRF